MVKIVSSIALLLVSLNSYSYDQWDASKLVEAYSKMVACQLVSYEGQSYQYKAVTIAPGMSDMEGFGSQYLVYWEGDLGCQGGNGTIVPNFTLVEHSGFMSAKPVIKLDFESPKLNLVRVTSFSAKDGLVTIKGVTYGKNDRQHSPTKNVTYILKLKNYKLVQL